MKICIIGAGAFGIAMCKALENNNDINIYTNNEEERNILENERENKKLFPNVKIDDEVNIYSNLKEAIYTVDIIICAIPFQFVEGLANDLKNIYDNQIIICVTKGVDKKTFKNSNDIFKEVLNTNKICSLSGPSFAIDVVNKENISLMLAGENDNVSNLVKKIFINTSINIEITKDEIGIMACSAIKNAIAIGSGILTGMEKSESAKAAYLTNGLHDMELFIESLGGNKETVYSYAGVGDLILTCSSLKSRNCSFGYHIGKGKSVEEALAMLNGKTVEGIEQIEAIYNYMLKNKLNFKIISILYDIIKNNKNIELLK